MAHRLSMDAVDSQRSTASQTEHQVPPKGQKRRTWLELENGRTVTPRRRSATASDATKVLVTERSRSSVTMAEMTRLLPRMTVAMKSRRKRMSTTVRAVSDDGWLLRLTEMERSTGSSEEDDDAVETAAAVVSSRIIVLQLKEAV